MVIDGVDGGGEGSGDSLCTCHYRRCCGCEGVNDCVSEWMNEWLCTLSECL